jgi:predicted metal-dependent peptidase
MATDIRITKARSQLIIEHPFFGALAMNLIVKPAPGMATMATDGRHLYYRPGFLDEPDITPLEVKRIVAHEVGHCMLGHHTRRSGRDPERWNIACDHAVNLILKSAGFVIPPDRYCDERFRNMTAERIYQILQAEEKAQQPEPEGQDRESYSDDQDRESYSDESDESSEDPADPPNNPGAPSPDSGDGDDGQGDDPEQGGGDGQADDGGGEQGDGDGVGQPGEPDGEPSGNGGGTGGEGDDDPVSHGDPGRDGEVLDAAPAHDQAALDESAQEWDVFTRQAVNIARKQGEGKVPGFLESVVEHLDDPRTDWREVYRRFVDPMSATKDYSWTQPNRRLMSAGYYVPGLVSDGVQHVAIIIDSSGSIDDELLSKFAPEAQASLDEGAIDKITLIFADTDVRSVREYTTGELMDFTIVGRGSTRFDTSLAWLTENAPDIACAVYFTDGYCNDFGLEPGFPVLWALYTPPQDYTLIKARMPFGETVDATT